jgi:hypothetical protein
MGAWATTAYGNDGVNWFDQMFAVTGLAAHVKKTPKLDVVACHQEVRAAANVVVALGQAISGRRS